MKRAGGLVLTITACALGACQLVAGIQDRVLVAPDDATTGASSGTSSGGSSGSMSPGGGSGGPEASAAADGAGVANDLSDAPADDSSPVQAQDDATVTADAQTDSSSAAAPDSSGALDAGPPKDGGSSADAGGIVDASSPDASFVGIPCSQLTNYIFCDDFDSVTDATTGWTWTSFGLDGGSVQLGQNAPATAPNYLSVVVPPVAGSYSIGEVLGTVANFTLSFDLRLDVDSLDEIPYAIIAQMNFTQPDGGTSSVNYSFGSGVSRGLQVFINGVQTYVSLPVPPVRQWIHVTVTYNSASGVTTTQNGVALGGDAGAGIVMAPGTATLIVGDVYATPPQSGTLAYSMDDVVLQGTE
jgi:hypothetical protein